MTDAGKHDDAGGIGAIRFWGRHTALGLAIAAFALFADQLNKYWMIEIYGIAERGRVAVSAFLDLVMVWNPGISYGLLPQDSDTGRIALMALSAAAICALFLWMSNATSRLVAISLGLILGGALGNLIDRFMHGAVADFFSFHYASYYWYVFNLADVAITVGVIGLVLDWLMPSHTNVPKGV